MADKLIMTNGEMKSTNLLDTDDPSVWRGLGQPGVEEQTLYAYVAAMFRAVNLKANMVSSVPFVLYRGKREFDKSADWENKVGFLPNPQELLRLDTMSYMASNSIYNLLTSDVVGFKPRGIYNAVPFHFTPYTNPSTAQLEYIERKVGARTERYAPDGRQIVGDTPKTRLVYMWRLDHTTEVLPSMNTEARAAMSAAGQIYYTDLWIKHFYKSGGIKPTLIAMEGLIDKEAKEEKERSWSNWLRGLGGWTWKKARIYNAKTMDIKPFGSGVDDLKDNEVYRQAIANVAMAYGMPLSLLLSNSANYATAQQEAKTWLESDIIPFCDWLAFEYTRQVYEPLGLRMEFQPEALDPQQEDETQRAQAVSTFVNYLNQCPTYDVFIGICETFGYELSESLVAAAETYYADKEKKAEEMQEQMGNAGVVVGPDGKPIPVTTNSEEETGSSENSRNSEDEEEKKPAPFPPKKTWTPTLDELEEMRVYREVALRKHKKGESLTFEYEPHHGGLPEDVRRNIFLKLSFAKSAEDVKAAFAIAEDVTPTPEYKVETIADPAILELAAAINKLAEAKGI